MSTQGVLPRRPLGALRPSSTMPGRLGKVAALAAAIVLFLAALPILTMIAMSFSAIVVQMLPTNGSSSVLARNASVSQLVSE